ncbi:SIR2 family protein [Luteococcus sanguinis]|uniref:SIR2 family protein n=1 Tax=Luteococcus sanguinis TaxID=174038 RepID=A0ABW1X816_9ACTN
MPNPLSPSIMLATSMQAQPGVYALLLGSGVSTGAGVPTGWGVVKDLVRRVAALEDPDTLSEAEADPETWWTAHHGEPLGYSTLLEALAPTPSARQALLADFFEPTDQEREEGIKTPSRAHLAIAELVKRGAVKVILTTNFDRLMEQALETVGVAPQVIYRPEAVQGMKPLAHAPATVIKLHGDYLDLGTRNTPSELESYPDEWKTLVSQVLDEYGLVISGWSADWDTALVALMEAAPNRRYPLFWDQRSSRGDTVQRLLAARAGTMVPAAGADELFTELASNLTTLDKLAEPPLTTAMAVGRLKRYLPNPVHRIDLHDLVMAAVDRAGEAARAQPLDIPDLDEQGWDELYQSHRDAVMPLLHLLATGVWHDTQDEHSDLWVEALQRLVDLSATQAPSGQQYVADLGNLRLYPAVLANFVVGVAAVARHREGLLLRVLREVQGVMIGIHDQRFAAHQLLDPLRLPKLDVLPRWNGQPWMFPASRLLREDSRAAFDSLIPDDEQYLRLTHDWEYRLGLVQTKESGYFVFYGDSAGELQWGPRSQGIPACETRFLDRQTHDHRWPWTDYLGGETEQQTLQETHRGNMREVSHRARLGLSRAR